jgi:hypothetical protein
VAQKQGPRSRPGGVTRHRSRELLTNAFEDSGTVAQLEEGLLPACIFYLVRNVEIEVGGMCPVYGIDEEWLPTLGPLNANLFVRNSKRCSNAGTLHQPGSPSSEL